MTPSNRPRAAARVASASPRRPLVASPPGGLAFAVVAALVLLSYAPRLGGGFSNDDFTFLDKVRGRPLASLLGGDDLLAGWWRPWSRELHFALLDRLAPGSSALFHAVNLLLWLGTLAFAFALLRALLGRERAVPVLAGSVAAAAWGIFVAWACCSQDLWMLLFVCAFLLALVRGRAFAAGAALFMALLSKETALVALPLGLWLVAWREGAAALSPRRAGPAFAAVVLWALVHPSLGGRWVFGSHAHVVPVPHAAPTAADLAWLLAPINLERAPQLADGLPWRALEGLAWALGLGGLAWVALGAAPAIAAGERRRLATLGLVWWAIAWSPMLAPFLRWHSYYGWLGLPGLWIALAALVPGRRAGLAALVAIVAYLRPFEAAAPSDDWGAESHQRTAARQMTELRAAILAQVPHPAPHTRIFLAGLPDGVGFHTGRRESVPLRVWTHEPTIEGCLFSEYEARPAGSPAGEDRFFVVTADLRLLPVAAVPPPVPDSLRRDPLWPQAEEQIAHAFTLAGEHRRALAGFARLVATYPTSARNAFHLAEAYEALGDRARGDQWRNRADSLVGSPPRLGAAYLAAVDAGRVRADGR